jgi:hypothetical protein
MTTWLKGKAQFEGTTPHISFKVAVLLIAILPVQDVGEKNFNLRNVGCIWCILTHKMCNIME